MGRVGGPPALRDGEGPSQCLHSSSQRRFTFCSPAESLDELTEQKDGGPPELAAAPHTPPSTPVKLEEGELQAGVGRGCPGTAGAWPCADGRPQSGGVSFASRSVEGSGVRRRLSCCPEP